VSLHTSSAMTAEFKVAEIVLRDGPDAVPIHPLALPHVVAAIDWLDRQTSPFLSRKATQEVLVCSQSKLLRLEARGEIESLLDGAIRKISAASIARRMVALAIMSHPIDGPALKARKPAKRYQKPPRVRTLQELEALRRANQRSHEQAEARKRREESRA
jgi:hypothetical protein